jgi:hypothetical protein
MSEIRYVTIPAAIELSIDNPMTGKSVKFTRDFEAFIKERTNDNGHFGKTLDTLMLGFAIRQAFLGAKAGSAIGLTLEQWDALCKSLREPTGGYNPEVMFQMLPMVRAVLDAPTTKPAVQEDAPSQQLS